MARFDSAQRTKILTAAIRVFARHGVHGASIRRVGQEAGLNSALLYYYFENKRTLYVEAVRQVILDLLDQFERRLRPFAAPRDRVRFFVDGVFDYYSAHPERMRLMGTVHTQDAEVLGEVIQGIVKNGLPVPLRVLGEGIERHELRALHPAQIWWAILGSCAFVLHMHQVLKAVNPPERPFPVPDLAAARRDLIQLLCDGIVLAPAAGRARRKTRNIPL